MTKLVADVRCESCQRLLVAPRLIPGGKVHHQNVAYVCLGCGRPYCWVGDPPRLYASSIGEIARKGD